MESALSGSTGKIQKLKYLDGKDVSPRLPVAFVNGKRYVTRTDGTSVPVITANAYRMRKLVLENGRPAPNPHTVRCIRKNRNKIQFVTGEDGRPVRVYAYSQYLLLKKRRTNEATSLLQPPAEVTPPPPPTPPLVMPAPFSPTSLLSREFGLFSPPLTPLSSLLPMPTSPVQQTNTRTPQQSRICNTCNGTGILFFSHPPPLNRRLPATHHSESMPFSFINGTFDGM